VRPATEVEGAQYLVSITSERLEEVSYLKQCSQNVHARRISLFVTFFDRVGRDKKIRWQAASIVRFSIRKKIVVR
jgi:hypothetical protein